MSDDEPIYVCYQCIGDEFLSAAVLEECEHAFCCECGGKVAAVPMEDLGDRIKDIIANHFYQTSSEPEGFDYLLAKEGRWTQPGERLEDVVAEIAQVSESVAGLLCEYLYDSHPFDPSDGEDHPYADDAQYEERPADDSGIQESWRSFKRELLKNSRYFSDPATTALDMIFKDLELLIPPRGESLVREVCPEHSPLTFFRARVCFDDNELKRVLAAPVKELGPPPHRYARSGRMNAEGISAFYGSLDEVTCLSEVRPPVGSYVVIGSFHGVRRLRLLDCDALVKLYTHGSYFDPGYSDRKSRVAFLRSFVDEISRPVMPRDQDYEYLPTQVVAEYLASRPEQPFDGIIFPASQTGGVGRNVVLFHHAARVEPYDLSNDAKISFSMGWKSDDAIAIFEDLPDVQEHTEPPGSKDEIFNVNSFPLGPAEFAEFDDSLDERYRDASLRLSVEEIQIRHIKSVAYDCAERGVTRQRSLRTGSS